MKEHAEKKEEAKSEFKEITPLKDHLIVANEHRYDCKKGEKIKVHAMFLPNLKTEKVIK